MTIGLAYDPLILSHGGNTVRLKPSLRAGLLMAQKHSVEELAAKISELHLGTISHLVAIGCDDIDQTQDLIAAVLASTGVVGLADFHDALFAFIEISLGLSNEPDTDAKAARPSSFNRTDALTDLYEFATGWLSWTPAEAWAATPAEIVHARKGHSAMLRAIHRSGDEDSDPRDLPSEAEIQTGLAKLRHLSGEVA